MARRRKATINQQKPKQSPPSEGLRELLFRGEKGDVAVLGQLQQYLDAHPELWKEAGDLGLQAERSLTELAAGENLLASESIKRQLVAMREELVGASTNPLEHLLAERVVLTWLAVTYSVILLAQNQSRDLSPSQEQYLERRQRQANQQFLAATKALATVRKLLPTDLGAEDDGLVGESASRKTAPNDARQNSSEHRRSDLCPEQTESLPEALARRMNGIEVAN